MTRPPRPGVPIRPAPQTVSPSRPQPLLPPNVRLVPILPIYAPSYAPAPFINYVQPAPRIFSHTPVLTSPYPISAPHANRPLTPPSSNEQQSPVLDSQHSRIAPSPTLTSVSTTTLSSISKEDTVSNNFCIKRKKLYMILKC